MTPEPNAATTILVAEDDEGTRSALVDLLRTMGYTVFSAATGAEAVRKLERLQGDVDIVLSDVQLPDAEGRDLCRDLGRRWPKPRFVLMSGESLSWEIPETADPRYRWLNKPFSIAQLKAALELPEE